MRKGYDSTSATAVPADGDIYLGYIDGNYQSYEAMVKRFPGKLVVPISVNANGNVGLVLDGPPDNGTWPEVVAWVVRRRAAGVDPTVYTNLASWQTAMAAFRSAGVDYPQWWIASWDGVDGLISGTVGKQYNSVANRYDTSVFADTWPGVDSPGSTGSGSSSTPGHPAGLAEEMAFLISVTPDPTGPAGNTGAGIFLVSGALIAHVEDPASYTGFVNAGLAVAAISPDTYAQMVSVASALQGSLSGSLAVTGNLSVGTPAAG